MKRALLAWVVAITIALPSAATAKSSAVVTDLGVSLSFGQCYGDQPSWNRTFACDTNAGAQVIVASFFAPAGVTQLTGMEIIVDVLTSSAVPDWWRLKTSGSCRQSALSINFIPSSPESNCRDLWEQQAFGAIGSYTVGYNGNPNRIRMRAVIARPAENVGPLEVDVEYFAFNLVISNVRTTGADACIGCSRGARLVLNAIKFTQPAGVGDFVLNSSARAESNQLDWQGGATDPVRNTTWGNVKALYR